MVNTGIFIAVVAYLAISFLWALFVRRLHKTRVRVIGIAVSFVLAVVGTVFVKMYILEDAFITGTLIPWLSELLQNLQMENSATLIELLNQSPTLCEVVLGCAVSILAPLVMLVLFFLFSFLSWIVYLLVVLISGSRMREKDRESAMPTLRAALLTAVGCVLVLVVWLIPLSAYSEIAPVLYDAVQEAEMLDEESANVVDLVMKDYVEPINENPLIVTFRSLGGRELSCLFTDFDVNGTNTHLREEANSVTKLACNIILISGTEFDSYGETEAVRVLAVADAFSESAMLPAIAGELIYNATEAWLEGKPFIGVERDALYVDESGLMNDFIDATLEILHADAQNMDAICADIDTVANMIATLIRGDVFAGFSDTDRLLDALSREGLVSGLVELLGDNSSMKRLIPEVTNIGMRAIASTLGIYDNVDAVYSDFLDTVAGDLNEIKLLQPDKQVETLTETLADAFDSAGMAVDSELVSCYAISMVDTLLVGDEPVTPESIQAFFLVYAWSSEEYSESVEGSNASSTETLSQSGGNSIPQELLEGTVFAGMSEDALRQSSVAALARAVKKIAELDAEDDTFTSQAAEILKTECVAAISNTALVEKLENVNITSAVSTETIRVVTSLQSAATMAETTVIVTLDRLLVDSSQAADKITSENAKAEADAIESIFKEAKNLMNVASGDSMDLTAVAGSVGGVLDALQSTASFGQDQTKSLFTAVMQSSQVREAADTDVITATQLADKGSSGDNVSYTDTFNTVSQAVTVMGTLGNGEELEEDEIVDLIRNINPQTAGMIEVYATPTRFINSYGVPANQANVAAPLISNTFSYMADAEMDDEQYDKEAVAINQILTLVMTARDHSEDPNHDNALFGDDGILDSADHTVEVLMSSHALAHSLRETLIQKDGSILFDPFELSGMISEKDDRHEAEELRQAMVDYYAVPEQHTEENRETLILLAALMGVDGVDALLV